MPPPVRADNLVAYVQLSQLHPAACTYVFAERCLLEVQQMHQHEYQSLAIILGIWCLLLESCNQRVQLLQVIIILQKHRPCLFGTPGARTAEHRMTAAAEAIWCATCSDLAAAYPIVLGLYLAALYSLRQLVYCDPRHSHGPQFMRKASSNRSSQRDPALLHHCHELEDSYILQVGLHICRMRCPGSLPL